MSAHLDHRPAIDEDGGGRRVLLLAACSAAAFLLLAVIVAAGSGPLPTFDAWLSGVAHDFALDHPLWRSVMGTVTRAGSTTVVAPLAALGCLALLALRRWRQAVFVAAALIVTVSTRLAVLAIIARPRPVEQLAPASGFAFPSGHSTASAAAALILVLVCRPMVPSRGGRIVLAVLGGLWAVAVGVSRVALVVHWPTDVIGAWLFVFSLVPVIWITVHRLLGPDPTLR